MRQLPQVLCGVEFRGCTTADIDTKHAICHSRAMPRICTRIITMDQYQKSCRIQRSNKMQAV